METIQGAFWRRPCNEVLAHKFIHNSGYSRWYHILRLEVYGPYSSLERCLNGHALTHKFGSSQTEYTCEFPITSRYRAVTGNKCNVWEQRFEEKLKKYRGPRFVSTKLQLVQHAWYWRHLSYPCRIKAQNACGLSYYTYVQHQYLKLRQ